jgi:predicted oxidoreductase (fatty acid repression mutant protein)
MKTTQEYFNMTSDELLEDSNNYGYTREECKLFDEGVEVVFFDDEKELEEEKVQFDDYIKSHDFTIKAKVKTINERIAVILV